MIGFIIEKIYFKQVLISFYQGEVDPGEGNQVGLELIQVNIKSSVVGESLVYPSFKRLIVFTLQIGERQSRMKRPRIIVNIRLNLQR